MHICYTKITLLGRTEIDLAGDILGGACVAAVMVLGQGRRR
jgi:hypothetical protein